ncbi:MAG: hypothetical protein KAH14_02155 [Clostridiales bacterium]|nr:hypothetical protein [Clostridiales bacterium]
MKPREVIQRVIDFNNPPRIGYDLKYGHYTDFRSLDMKRDKSPELEWQKPDFFADIFPKYLDFDGFLRLDDFGNLWGKMSHDLTGGGEVMEGVLQNWEDLDSFKLPDWDNPERYTHIPEESKKLSDYYQTAWIPGFPFSLMRKMRKMENFLMDIIIEKENVMKLNDMVVEMLVGMIENYGSTGVDCIFFCEDWGLQDRLLINPVLWREMFKPSFKILCDCAKKNGLKVFMHSCGYIYDILEDLIEVGVDVFQFDQPALMGMERVAEIFDKRATLFAETDIQKVLPTGDRELIENSTEKMVKLFHKNGGFIARDYGDYRTIQVDQEWAQWMRDKFYEFGGVPDSI